MPLTLDDLKQRDMTAMARIKALIERNRNPVACSQDQFEAWLDAPKPDLFKRRAAEVLQTMRIMRLIAADRGGNPGWEVARQMPRMNEYLKQAKAEAAQQALRRAA